MSKHYKDVSVVTGTKAGATIVPSYIPTADIGLATHGVKAAKTFGSNTSVITLTAVAEGAGGNEISLDLIDPGTTNTLSIDVQGKAIKVLLGYATGAVITTGAALVTAINEDPAAAALVLASAGGVGLMAAAFDNLSGGVTAIATSPKADYGIQLRNSTRGRIGMLVVNTSATYDAIMRIKSFATNGGLAVPDRVIEIPAASTILYAPFTGMHETSSTPDCGPGTAHPDYVQIEFASEADSTEYDGGNHDVGVMPLLIPAT